MSQVVSSDDGYVELSTPSGFNKLAAVIAKEGGLPSKALAGGKRRRASKKSSKKASKKRSSRKQKGGSDLEGGKRRRASKKSSKKSSKKASKKRSSRKQKRADADSMEMWGGKRRRSSKKSSSRKRSSRKASKKSSSRKQKREMPEGAKAFNVFAMYVAKEMDMKFGGVVMKVAAAYNNKVKEANPGITAVESSKKAKALFDKDSKEARMKIAKEAERVIAQNKAAKKAKNA